MLDILGLTNISQTYAQEQASMSSQHLRGKEMDSDPGVVEQGLLGNAASTCRALLHRNANKCSTCFQPPSRLLPDMHGKQPSLSTCITCRAVTSNCGFQLTTRVTHSTYRTLQSPITYRDKVQEQSCGRANFNYANECNAKYIYTRERKTLST
ncbi:hypothetical protein CC79DRAFT_168425 [Sarocladium strictum]